MVAWRRLQPPRQSLGGFVPLPVDLLQEHLHGPQTWMPLILGLMVLTTCYVVRVQKSCVSLAPTVTLLLLDWSLVSFLIYTFV